MTELAILGRQPELGRAEIEALVGAAALEAAGPHLLSSHPLDLDRLGGSVKLARLLTRQPGTKLSDLELDLADLPTADAKLTFGISTYGPKLPFGDLQAWGLGLKKRLGSARLVLPRRPHTDLTAAQLKFNRILEKGFELVVVQGAGELIVGLTTAVQDIDAYAARDHGRPERDAKIGMLPPKLAQIMINLAGPEPGAIVDPFGGSGVIAQEALLASHRTYSSDLSPTMVRAATENLTWLATNHQHLPAWSVELADARQLKLPPGPLTIVTEGYLGEPLSAAPSPQRLVALDREISGLTSTWLRRAATQLPNGRRIVLAVPAWHVAGRDHHPRVIDEIPRLGYTQVQFHHAPGRLIYRRPGQIVGRHLLVLEKI